MNFNLEKSIEILERTPQTLESLLSGLSEDWLYSNEGEGTWNAVEILGHLIESELTNWIPRIETILQQGEDQRFPPFDRFAHLKKSEGESLEQKLVQFKTLRSQNLVKLICLVHPEKHLELTGIHPEHGKVKLRELLSTIVVHDLTHISQITRVMAEHYRTDVGPWVAYLGILNRTIKD